MAKCEQCGREFNPEEDSAWFDSCFYWENKIKLQDLWEAHGKILCAPCMVKLSEEKNKDQE